MKIKILIAEDHELTRQRIAFGLKKYSEIEVLAEAENGKKIIDLAIKLNPDLILMDISMPVLNGIDATKEIKQYNPNIKIIMFTSYTEKENVLSAFNSGADAYCMKNIKIDELINIIKTVNEGTMWIDSSVAAYIMEYLQSKTISNQIQKENQETYTDFGLTPREKDVLRLIAEGLSNKDISEQLSLSVYTVKYHVSNVIQKLSVDDRTQAALLALKERIL
ncbi:MAG: response regulator transcription factor [bacterium]